MALLSYLSNLSAGRLILWCYFIWYAFFVARYFDSSPRLWVTSLGIGAIVGVALVISTTAGGQVDRSLNHWQRFRLFLMPFCVSSFSALVKGRGFVLIFSPSLIENALAFGLCLLFCGLVALLKRFKHA